MLTRRHRDEGSIMVMIIGFTAIVAVLIVIGVDVSKVFLARRALSAAADSAAIAAAQGVDTRAVYEGPGPRCGRPLPLSRGRADELARASVRDRDGDLHRLFVSTDAPRTTVVGGTVSVELSGTVAVPFGRVLTWLDPSRQSGEVQVTETSRAQSPVAGGAC